MFTTKNFTLENGQSLADLTLAYETHGRLARDSRNAILITHGFTSSHHAAGPSPEKDALPGFWDGLIGPGKTIDTDRYFVVSSNMFGSSYGSTAPRSTNPATGKPYGPDFPAITLRDIVTAQKALLDSLGVRHLVAVAGPSFGGYQAFVNAPLLARLKEAAYLWGRPRRGARRDVLSDHAALLVDFAETSPLTRQRREEFAERGRPLRPLASAGRVDRAPSPGSWGSRARRRSGRRRGAGSPASSRRIRAPSARPCAASRPLAPPDRESPPPAPR